MKIFSERLKEIRQERNITQDMLATETGITQSMISQYEIDKCSPTAENIVILCKYFKVSADFMLGLKDE